MSICFPQSSFFVVNVIRMTKFKVIDLQLVYREYMKERRKKQTIYRYLCTYCGFKHLAGEGFKTEGNK